ncbi:MAG: alcohol dehydrogenase catalytic domain-containing protein [Fimbriimonadales bacterium]
MKAARYYAGGDIRIEEVCLPEHSGGDLVLSNVACALCSGELMSWYMDRKAPTVIGHEVCGIVEHSFDSRFPVGSLVIPHHHAACERCPACKRGAHVHCAQWKATRLIPGGMSEKCIVPSQNLADCHVADDLSAQDAALAEPIACVYKSVMRGRPVSGARAAVIGLGSFGLMHSLVLKREGLVPVGIELRPERRGWAEKLGIAAVEKTDEKFEFIWVCPGSEEALRLALSIATPNASVVMFAPFAPESPLSLDFEALYFTDLKICFSYSAGPHDMQAALFALREKVITATQVVSDFISLEELPQAYEAMKRGEILKPMVMFQ